eukprot:CAMPEP_0171963928 /NCGR_PEP_ID=MMETSP0993-20121228/178644_1 /TAXON_ID=483369 /ORGANISM="non described non described, Strain CCMP2098" /LENGTH=48 /DNA_ID= /DNA_START= /DNA_END= /DNA_ORIENTATION=
MKRGKSETHKDSVVAKNAFLHEILVETQKDSDRRGTGDTEEPAKRNPR